MDQVARREAINRELARAQAEYAFPSFFADLAVVSPAHLYDGLHFTTEGYSIFADIVHYAMRRFLPLL